ncbi:uncharacterized protein LOC143447489 [Clavelina lepadiformis]|uniref:Glutaredoxin domain-containing protein n=1 Tax=Clavelina lepadiformis TaxID=159417 RepID=A0ABP0FXK5_CLALP
MTANAVRGFVKSAISANRVALFSKSYCPYCNLAKDVLKKAGVRKPFVIELDHRNDSQDVQAELTSMTSVNTVPYVFVDNEYIGGGTTIAELFESGRLDEILSNHRDT